MGTSQPGAMHELVMILMVVGVVVVGLTMVATVVLGFLVWLAGSDWARRPQSHDGVPLPPR